MNEDAAKAAYYEDVATAWEQYLRQWNAAWEACNEAMEASWGAYERPSESRGRRTLRQRLLRGGD